MKEFFSRSRSLLGDETVERLAASRVLVVGTGGVGSWAAEALVRTGIGAIALMDDDVVAASNVNRQCPATSETIGLAKVEVMAARLRSINPGCAVEAWRRRYGEEGGGVDFSGFDAVIDAIDSPACKARLVLDALEAGKPLFSSMGAALRTDPSKVRATRFEKVEGDGLAKALRARFRKLGVRPGRFTAVWSGEAPLARPAQGPMGSIMPVTAVFGMFLAAETVKAVSSW